MGPSVKFVSPNKGLISKKKNGGQFFSRKKTIPGRGVRGGFGKRPYFFPICFSEPFPNIFSFSDFLSSVCLPLICGSATFQPNMFCFTQSCPVFHLYHLSQLLRCRVIAPEASDIKHHIYDLLIAICM